MLTRSGDSTRRARNSRKGSPTSVVRGTAGFLKGRSDEKRRVTPEPAAGLRFARTQADAACGLRLAFRVFVAAAAEL
jgi:hypothetical protein